MSANITDKYLKHKVDNILAYINIMLKKIYKIDFENTKVFEACLNRYINEFIMNEKDIGYITKQNKEFFDKNRINSEEQKKFIIIMLDIITQKEEPIKDLNFIDNINLFSLVMAIAYDIEEQTNQLNECDIGYKEAIEYIKKKYKPYSIDKLDDKIKTSNLALKRCVNKNIKTNNEFMRMQNENPFYLEFYKFKSIDKPPSNILEVKLKDSSKELAKFNRSKIEAIISQKQVLYNHTNIIMEMLTFKVLEMLFKRKRYEKFVIRLPDEFLGKKTNKKRMLSLTRDVEVRKKICFEIDHRQLEKYYDDILEIKNSNFAIAISNIDEKGELTEQFKKIANYIIVNSKVCKDFEEIKNICISNKINLLERDIGKEEVILEL